MPRKKITTLPISQLNCHQTIIAELKGMKEFCDVDFSNITISAKQYVAPTIHPKNLRKAIDYIERHISMNCSDTTDYYCSRSSLAKITKITRPTINRWYADGLIKCDTSLSTPDSGFVIFHLPDLLIELRTIKKAQK